MTDREKAIVMAYTGICMLTGDKLNIFNKYVEDILDKPVFTHELGLLADEIKKKSKADFMALCADESPNEWTPCSERLPEEDGEYIVTIDFSNPYVNRDLGKGVETLYFTNDLSSVSRGFAGEKRPGWYDYDGEYGNYEIKGVLAWMSRPEPYTED